MKTSQLVRRHAAVTRITHWVNALALLCLLMSGLQIFNAHPALYWGPKSEFQRPWLAIGAVRRDGQPVGLTKIAGKGFETTGVLGWSGPPGARSPVAFPGWATIPSWRDLATGRRWHFFFAWVLVFNGLVWLLWGLLSGRLRRDLLPTRADLAPGNVRHELVTHARLQFPKGEAARRYNVLQKLSYLLVALGLSPLMVATGLTMSPAFNAATPWLVELFGGRQSARSIHFLCAAALVLFVIVHLAMVVASGPWNNLRSMVTGRYRIETEGQIETEGEGA